MNIKKNENGDKIVSRSEGSPEVRDVIFPLAALVGTKYLGTDRLGQVMQAVRDYYLCPEITIPADAADAVMPTFGAIVEATEAAALHRLEVSRARSASAKMPRKKGMTDSPEINVPEINVPEIIVPEIIVPPELHLASIVRAAVTIHPQEYLGVTALFMIRGFKVGEQRAFYGYYSYLHWNQGAIDGPEARMKTAQYWEQRTGERRFQQDPAAHGLMCSLLSLLPADKRAYLLADGARVEVDAQGRVVLSVPKPIHDVIKNNPGSMEAIKQYADSHGLENADLGMIPIPFSIEMNNR